MPRCTHHDVHTSEYRSGKQYVGETSLEPYVGSPDTNRRSIMPKTAIISGGARGIGRCLVRRFLEIGYKVKLAHVDHMLFLLIFL